MKLYQNHISTGGQAIFDFANMAAMMSTGFGALKNGFSMS